MDCDGGTGPGRFAVIDGIDPVRRRRVPTSLNMSLSSKESLILQSNPPSILLDVAGDCRPPSQCFYCLPT